LFGTAFSALLFAMGCAGETPAATHEIPVKNLRDSSSMVRGVSFVGCPKPSDSSDFIDVKRLHANFISLMPFAYAEPGSSDLQYQLEGWQWWGESPEGIKTCIRLAREQGIESMIKPQLWIGHGSYTGHFKLESDSQWKVFEENYSRWILYFAAIAEEYHVPIFCIGTELDDWTQLRPEFWSKLIAQVRSVYHGKLTYACNWDCLKKIPFWHELDFIGVDAYFPLSPAKTPVVDSLVLAWKPIVKDLHSFSDSLHRQILFTEWGYRSVDYCADRPWEFHEDSPANPEAQANCYKALMESCCNQHWFAGGFVWKWFPESNRGDRHSTDEYSPQDKAAEELLIECWKQKK
jgi:hypothetical protein